MRTLSRNKQIVYYALYDHKEENLDAYGNPKGTYKVFYKPVDSLMANVSPAKGVSELTQFGVNEDYTRTIVTDKVLPISETTVFWVGFGKIEPYDAIATYVEGDLVIKDGQIAKYDGEGFVEVPHNHVTVKVAKSINSTTYAVKEVDVT